MKDSIYNILRSAIENSINASNDGIEYEKAIRDEAILMNKIPIILNPDEYKDAKSTGNPGGNLIPLWKFSQLVDPIPEYVDFYVPSNYSTEDVYGDIINGATTDEYSSFATGVIANAKREYENSTFPSMDGNPDSWHPVYAIPGDWYEAKDSSFNEITFDLNSLTDEDDSLEWKIVKDDNSVQTIALESSSKMLGATISIQMVSFDRPWLKPLIFDTAGWYLNGQSAGFCSSGQDDGQGVIPTIPSSLIIGTLANINANWSVKDQQIIDNAKDNDHQLSLGPLMLNSGQNSSICVVGWMLSNVPFSPQLSKLETGSVLVKNSGSYVAKFSMTYQQKGKPVSLLSGNIEVLMSKVLKMPDDALDINVEIEIMTWPLPEKWTTVKSLKFYKPTDKCYELTGTTLSPKIQEISC